MEVDSMGFDLDPFSDVASDPATSNARAGGKFQPRAKAQLRRGTSTVAASVVPDTAVEKAANLVSTVSDNMVSAKPIDIGNDALLLGISVGDIDSTLGKSVAENPDIFSGLEFTYDFVTQSSSGTEIPASASNDKNKDGRSNLPGQNVVNSSAFTVCNAATLNPVTFEEASIQMKDRRLESEESGGFHGLDSEDIFSNSVVASDSHTRRFQPQPKSQDITEELKTTILPPDAVELDVPPPTSQFVPSDCQSDDVLDYSSISFGDFTTSEHPMNEERSNIARASCANDANVLYSENVPEEPENEGTNSGRRRDMNESEKPSRQLRKRAARPQLVDEPEDETHDNGDFPADPPSGSAADDEDNDFEYREEDDDDEYRAETTCRTKRASNRSKKSVAEKEKPARKRKRANDVTGQPTEKPPKKFSHSTRRKKRLQELLKMPEDELDFRTMACRDIVLLAEYKEQLAIKEAKASKTSAKNQSGENSLRGEHANNEEDGFASEQDTGDADDQRNSRDQLNLPLFNSQSFMNKTPRVRWSKQDTELFYEGVRQFGTDLSMIQQLFPGRSRHQIKLKLKKEERQQPFKLYEAVSTRAKDHSYFEKVIEQLQQVAAQADQELAGDDSVDAMGKDEAELYSETNEGVDKSEHVENVEVEEQEANATEVHSPVKSDENDDDLDIWSSYRSEF